MEQNEQRVIKFRAWDGKQVVEDAAYLRSDGDAELAAFDDNSSVTWLQFTGLTDKNGKEIYEGDIVKVPDDWDRYGHMAGEAREIIFSFGSFRLKPKWSHSDKGHTFDDAHEEIEVISNIYENPELLK